MGHSREKRPWLAALLALPVPGLGHVYLREWLRAALWFGLVVSVAWVLVPSSVYADAEFTVGSLMAASRSVPTEANVAILFVTSLSMLDAYMMASAGNQQRAVEAGTTCPHCGRELDEDLEFCHWCTSELDGTGQ